MANKIYIVLIILFISKFTFSQSFSYVNNIEILNTDTSDISYKSFVNDRIKLNLYDLRKGTDSIKIRFWVNTLSTLDYIYELSYKDNKWVANKITYGTIIRTFWFLNIKIRSVDQEVYSITELTPVNSWDTIISSLWQNNILSIRNQSELDSAYNYNIDDGITYQVEYSTQSVYRYYCWTNPKHGFKKYWDTIAIINIAEIFKNDFIEKNE